MDETLKAIAALDAQIYTLSAEKKKTENDIKMLDKERERLADIAVSEMIETGCTMADVAGLKWGLRNNPPKAKIIDERLIPDKFFKMKKELNQTLINATLASGEKVLGVTIDNGSVSLTIRSKL